ncbi:MAG TPA: hypothetical protein VGP26_00700, partial [Actinophytocola sp.]|nr:hypothetical protein [Actinophytocola sp.]
MSAQPDTVAEPAAAPVPRPAPRRQARRTFHALTGWGFALPFALLFLVFTAGPVVASLFMSVTDLGSADLLDPFGVNIVGLDNY